MVRLHTREQAIVEAHSRGMSEEVLIDLVRHYQRHRCAFTSPYAIRLAIGQWRPGDAADDPLSWPTPKVAAQQKELNQHEERQRQQDRELAAREEEETEALNERFGGELDQLDSAAVAALAQAAGVSAADCERWPNMFRLALLRQLAKAEVPGG